MRPPREDYVRVTFSAHGFTFEPAIEWRDGDDFDTITEHLELTALWNAHENVDAMENARCIGKGIVATWPDRAYFVEVWQEGKRGFAQVFQPFGVPRNRVE